MKTSIITFHTNLSATIWALACLAPLFTTNRAQSQETIALPAVDAGWYDELGNHNPNNTNYFAGFNISGRVHNNFAVFDLSAVDMPIAEATLRLLNPGPPNFGSNNGFDSPDPSETYVLFDFNSDINSLVAGEGGLEAFDDLGSGVPFGSVEVTAEDNGQIVEVNLNAAGIAALENSDGLFAFGGAVTTIGQNNVREAVFAFTSSPDTQFVELRITTVPEPGALLLAGLAISAAGFRRP